MRLQDKVAIVTGAGRGNGNAIAVGFAREGARVIVADFDGSTAEATTREIASNGGLATAVRVDVSKRAEVQSMVDVAVRQHGRIDVLVSNAGVMSRFEFLDLPEEEWDRIIAVNL
ncbi:MAG: SDR family NAD(P)-dependent oxidoreductase, partial [Chloroflexi bacterium]|nr:SDR family NAD(P)-dependent oxidoreductase [Chloroflexota bacterium]